MDRINLCGRLLLTGTCGLIISDLPECGTHGTSPFLFITDDIIDDSIGEWEFSLIGRLDLVTLKFKIAESILRRKWKLKGHVQLIPLSKGYFIIKLDNEEDKLYIWAGNWTVEEKNLTVRNWEPNFNPAAQKSTSAFVWVNFPSLSIEYWKEKIIMQMGKALGRPIKVDETTLKKEAGFYASVFVEIDLTKAIPSKIWVEYKYGGFVQAIQIPSLPKFFNHCQLIGHYVAECRNNRKEQEQTAEVNAPKQVKQIWKKVESKKNQTPFKSGYDICFSTPSKFSEMEKKILQDMTEDIFNSHVDFPILNVEQTLKAASSAPSINEVIHIVPSVEKEVVHIEVPKIKQKAAKHISIIKTRNQVSGLGSKDVQIGKLGGSNSSQHQSNQ
ncbi:uncharacterized protein LOC113290794 [Papaver somniferum]|uniref:uncharacterized protein LOC113290794 n=1 Tax=Papaver somniferum TaxID=3469 RepID=UPI000E6F89CC|nr:uncharacterized protein LOC113290794 [Papaver somniferum]